MAEPLPIEPVPAAPGVPDDPIDPEPVAPDVLDEPMDPVDGVVEVDPGVVVVVELSAGLLQPANAIAAARASAATVPVLNDESRMSIFLLKRGVADRQPRVNLAACPLIGA